MAKEEKHGEHKKKVPHKIITTRAKDGSFGHEHMYEGESQPVFAGTSQNMEDLHSHMDDHFGGGGEPAQGGEEEAPAPGAAEAAE